ncbi:hypothetical protein BIWAKO_04831 [Bosea sp. BIWAKO-01]|nr:hypothetical protein BIWAKO_04831 [Bosea sp. BIWAKO-01]
MKHLRRCRRIRPMITGVVTASFDRNKALSRQIWSMLHCTRANFI